MTFDHTKFMDLALEEGFKGGTDGNVPVDSGIVRNREVIVVDRNQENSKLDATTHAEADAIRDACRNIGSTDLSGAVCYTSMEPCPMCCWAIHATGCDGLVLGVRHADFTASGGADYGNYSVEWLIEKAGRTLEIENGVRLEKCNTMRRDWLAKGVS